MSLDTDISSKLDNALWFKITAKRIYKADGREQQHNVRASDGVLLRDLRQGVWLTIWKVRNAGVAHMLEDASLKHEIDRRIRVSAGGTAN